MGGRSPGAGLTGEAQVSPTVLNGQDVMAANQHSTGLETALGGQEVERLEGPAPSPRLWWGCVRRWEGAARRMGRGAADQPSGLQVILGATLRRVLPVSSSLWRVRCRPRPLPHLEHSAWGAGSGAAGTWA